MSNPQPTPNIRRRKRAVGYCQREKCEDKFKSIYVLSPANTFWCPVCRQTGKLELERAIVTGEGQFREVRIEFEFSPEEERYKKVAIVIDNDMPVGKSYTLYAPLILTEKRAIKTAEALLAIIRKSNPLTGEVAIAREYLLSFDEPIEMFKSRLSILEKEWNKT